MKTTLLNCVNRLHKAARFSTFSSVQRIASSRLPKFQDQNPFLDLGRVSSFKKPANRVSDAWTSPATVAPLLIQEIVQLGQPDCQGLRTFAALLDQDFDDIHNLAATWSAEETKRLKNARITNIRRNVNRWNLVSISEQYNEHGRLALQRAAYIRFLEYASSHSANASVTSSRLNQLLVATDLRFPMEWMAQTRHTVRKIIMHVGPTNSGKTYQALKALAQARCGIYAGPLRLLAHEVYARFNSGNIGGLDGKPRACNLLTGEERRVSDPLGFLTSCTVEMVNHSRAYDVAVIDEIQMIADPGRGSAWTNAVLFTRATELHLCGEESAVELVQKLAKETGDIVEIKRYQRLSPLHVAPRSLDGDLSQLRPGDCLVTFSRNNIFALKEAVEKATKLKVAVAYGGLPPEVREEQARLFNEGAADILVASDAIGMGLNLKIRRVVFETLAKWNGTKLIPLPFAQVKQIGGRAGRFGMHKASPSLPDIDQPEDSLHDTENGQVLTLNQIDMRLLARAMSSEIKAHLKAVLLPPHNHLSAIWNLLSPTAKYSQLLRLVHLLARTNSNYLLPIKHHQIETATMIDHLEGLTMAARASLSIAPVPLRDLNVRDTFVAWASQIDKFQSIDLRKWIRETGLLPKLQSGNLKVDLDSDALLDLESMHKCLTLYLWLSYRFQFSFDDANTAREVKQLCEVAIQSGLSTQARHNTSNPPISSLRQITQPSARAT